MGVGLVSLTPKRGRRNNKSKILDPAKDSRQFFRDQAFFDRCKDRTLCTSKFAGAKRASAKNTSMYSLLDLFCLEASSSIFSSTRSERAMLTGCLRTLIEPLIICCFVNI